MCGNTLHFQSFVFFSENTYLHIAANWNRPRLRNFPCATRLFLLFSLSLRWRNNDHGGVSNHQPHECLLNRLFRRRSQKTSKLRVTGLCARNLPVTGEFPAQMASNAENVSIWWRHHVKLCIVEISKARKMSRVSIHCVLKCLATRSGETSLHGDFAHHAAFPAILVNKILLEGNKDLNYYWMNMDIA